MSSEARGPRNRFPRRLGTPGPLGFLLFILHSDLSPGCIVALFDLSWYMLTGGGSNSGCSFSAFQIYYTYRCIQLSVRSSFTSCMSLIRFTISLLITVAEIFRCSTLAFIVVRSR